MNTLFQNVLTASFHGSIVIAAVLALRLLLGRAAPKKYLCYLWVLAGLRLIMPFDIQSNLSLQPQTPPEAAIRWEQPASMWKSAGDTEESPQLPTYDLPEEESATPALPSSPTPSGISLQRVLPYLWLTVAVAFLGYNLYCYLSLRRRVRPAKKIAGGWETDGIETAFILGFVRPQIYIPTGMSPETQKYILAHERTHLDKADHWVKMLGFLALTIHWFNPLVWIAYLLLCKDIEMACDERVVQFMELSERKAYSTALLNCSTSGVHHAASPVAFGEVNVKNRIKSILNYRSPSFWSGLLSVIAIIFVTVCLLTNPTQRSSNDAALRSAKAFTAATQPPMEENPDWGVSIIADVLSPTTMNLSLGVGVEVPFEGSPIVMQQDYTLERWNGKEWEALPSRTASESVGRSTTLGDESTTGFYKENALDWSARYGTLSEGDYRIVLSLTRDGETLPHRAWFHLYAQTLTGEEAEAYGRVKDSLSRLRQCDYYTATISESSSQGSLLTSSVISRDHSNGTIHFYTGEYCYSTYPCDGGDSLLTSWLDAFYPGENTHISFSGESGVISDRVLGLTATRVDWQGSLIRDLCTYTLGEDGRLTGVNILRQTTTADGTLTQSRRAVSVVYSASSQQASLSAEDAFQAAKDSPWNIFFRVDDDELSPTGGEVWMALGDSHVGVSNYTSDGRYWLESWDGSHWNALETKGDASWGGEPYRLRSNTTSVWVDWSNAYGALEAGLYRMGKRFYDSEESIIQYAEFQVFPLGGVSGAGGQEAIARVKAAVEAVRSGSYCVSEVETSHSPKPTRKLQYIFWKYDGICATDYYDTLSGIYRHSGIDRAEDRDADLFYDRWVTELDLDNPNLQLYFPTGDSVISDREISFTGAYTTITGNDLSHYTFRFGDQGQLLSVTIRRDGMYFSDWTRVYTVEQHTDSEIRDHVEQVMAMSST